MIKRLYHLFVGHAYETTTSIVEPLLDTKITMGRIEGASAVHNALENQVIFTSGCTDILLVCKCGKTLFRRLYGKKGSQNEK